MSNLVITGVIDGPLPGGLPKAIQLHAVGDIADLSIYGIGLASNGGASNGADFTFEAGAVAAGTTLYVASEAESFETWFGFAPDATGSVANFNGDDAIELFEDGALVDAFGEVGVDGTGQPWEYLDGWAYRAPASGPSAVFDAAAWTFSGPDALDGEATNATAAMPLPMPGGASGPSVAINEFRISSSGDSDDTSNFVELITDPGASLDGLTLLAVSGEFAPGNVDVAVDLSGAVADADGIVLIANAESDALGAGDVGVTGLDFFGSPQTFLVVDGFTGDVGDDLDADDDGTPDAMPFDSILAGVSLEDGDDVDDFSYGDVIVPADGSFTAATAARQPDGTGDFVVGSFADLSGDTPGTPNAPFSAVINELRISSPGSSDDTSNFVEIFTGPGASLDGLTLLAVSGEFAPGNVDVAIDLSDAVADADGFVLVGNAESAFLEAGDVGVDGLDFFGSPQTFLLVEDFTGAVGDDLDADDDGTVDAAPFGRVLDSVAVEDGDDTPDQSYSSTILAAGGSFPPAALARSEDGTGGFGGLPFDDLSSDTPGSTNTPDVDAPRVTIMEIQGAGHVSGLVSATPLDPTTGGGDGSRVTTGGIVTAVDSNGFYLQDALGDGDIATSDAIFVFTGSAPNVDAGDAVDVVGTVSEFYPGGQGSRNLSTTQLGGGVEVTVLSTGNALPDAVRLGGDGRQLPTETIDDDAFASFDPLTDGIDFWESIEGMRVVATQPVAVSGTNRFGEVFTVVDGGAGATGLSERGTLNISPDDFNPEKVQIDWDFGDVAVEVSTGAQFDDVVGVVTYSFGNYEIAPTETVVVLEESTLEAETTELVKSANQLSIVSYNVLNLDPVVEEQALTNNGEARNVDDDIGNGRFAAIAEQIVGNLASPDIIGLQEIQDETGGETGDGVVSAAGTFEALIDAIDLADDGVVNGSTTYDYVDNTFIEDLASGGQPGGNIRTGFLYDTARVTLFENSVRTISRQTEGAAFEGARLPLVARFGFNDESVWVVNNHLSSKGGSAPILGVEQPFDELQEDPTVNGSLDERQAQAQAVANAVSNGLRRAPEANVVVLGDFNEFEFVSPLETLEDAGLANLTNTLPENERYSFEFQGNSQSLDHILVTGGLLDGAQYDVVHVNSEFAETPGRASDHDPAVALLTLGEAPLETVRVALEVEKTGRFGANVVQSIDDVETGEREVPTLTPLELFRDADIGMRSEGSRGPGDEDIVFFRGEMGVFSPEEPFELGRANAVNAGEKLAFKVLGRELGDALEVEFDFGLLDGAGEVRVEFFLGRTRLDIRDYDVAGETLVADLDGTAFDAVKIGALDDTAFTLDGIAFERLVDADALLV